MRPISLLLCLLLCAGCGQKGALVLPDKHPKTALTVPAAGDIRDAGAR